jgi:hypothetical protein
MITKDDLMIFVDPDSRGIGQPWSKGDVTYFTNGHVIIRMPRMPDIPENPDALDADYLFSKASPTQPIPDKWLPIPDVKPTEIKCDECGGCGRKFKNFDGDDWSRNCDRCNGSGKINPFEKHEIEGVKFAVQYLFYLRQLPNCQISPVDSDTPAWISFDGGDGLIMPCKY